MRILVFGALACALVVSACTKVGDQSTASSTAQAAGTIPGELRIAIQREPNTLNPILSAFTVEGMLNRLSFDTLLSVDGSGKHVVPILATAVPTLENGGISRDGLTITYHLHSGVTWQDGVPFTSKDVKFSWQAVMNDNNNVNERVGYEDVASVDTPNDTTVVFHLKHKFAPFINTVFAESDNPICIVPQHLLAKYKNINQVPFNEAPVGTGPFKVAQWVRGDHITLVANDNYFRGKPKLRRIVVREIPDENTSLNALRAHDIDWIFEASPELYKQLKDMQGIKVLLVQQPQTLPLGMNLSRPVLSDLRVRRAIAYAVDKQALVDKNTGGSAVVAWSDQPPYSWSYEPNVMKYPPDVARAKALLAQAGWTPGGGGILRKDGKPLTLQISYNVENATRRAVAVQVQSMLSAIGIDAQIKAYPANLFFGTYGQGGVMTGGKYDLAVFGWIAGYDPDDHSLFECDDIPRPSHPDGVNYFRYCTADMDAAQRAALGTYDQAARKKAYSRIQQLIARDLPVDEIWFPRMAQPINPDFKGFDPNPVNEAWDAYQWEI